VRVNALKSVDFPTFGRPTIAITGSIIFYNVQIEMICVV